MVGKILRIVANVGDQVSEDDPLLIMEAMKMEIEVVAPETGTVSEINVQVGDAVNPSTALCLID
jgi:glutaconyl-CoA/methylmalonyl-CoA decarboxylase subunit gamma